MKNTRNTKNRIFAIPAAVPAIPPKPNAAATRATTKNIKAQYNTVMLLKKNLLSFRSVNENYPIAFVVPFRNEKTKGNTWARFAAFRVSIGATASRRLVDEKADCATKNQKVD